MNKNKIGILTLTGLTVGPILGSSILIMPPMIYALLKDWAIVAWFCILILSCAFALIFGQMAVDFPGDGGAANAVEKAFGKKAKLLSSFFLMAAVVLGAVAILLAAAEYTAKIFSISSVVVGLVMMAFCATLLLRKITILGRAVSLLSTLSAGIIFLAAIFMFIKHPATITMQGSAESKTFLYCLLLLFWTTLGWEVLGNYSAEVREPKKTIIKSALLSFFCIASVELLVAAAVQWSDKSFWIGKITISTVLYSLFGNKTDFVAAGLTALLCCSTYILYVGGVARLTSQIAEEKYLPIFFTKRSKDNVPYVSVLFNIILHIVVFSLVYLEFLNVEKLVAIANIFFIGNVCFGVAAWIKLKQK